MTVKTTLSFTDRHHRYLQEKVGQGVFATSSAAVAAAIEQMMADEAAQETALSAMAEEIRVRMRTPSADFVEPDAVFATARTRLGGE